MGRCNRGNSFRTCFVHPSPLAAPPDVCRAVPPRLRALRTTVLFIVVLAVLGAARPSQASERRANLENTLRQDRSPQTRQRAAVSLGELGDTAALPALILSLLGDREAAVRAACADALAALAEPGAQHALRAATHDESEVVRRQASAALNKLVPPTDGERSGIGQHVTIVVGRMGSKAKSGTMADIPGRLREAVIKEMRGTGEIDVIEDLKNAGDAKSGYSVDSSVTRLVRRTTPAGELEIACDISMIIANLPGRSVVGMVSGGASVIGPRGPSTRPTKAFLESLESEALIQAVKETHSSLVTFLRHQTRGSK